MDKCGISDRTSERINDDDTSNTTNKLLLKSPTNIKDNVTFQSLENLQKSTIEKSLNKDNSLSKDVLNYSKNTETTDKSSLRKRKTKSLSTKKNTKLKLLSENPLFIASSSPSLSDDKSSSSSLGVATSGTVKAYLPTVTRENDDTCITSVLTTQQETLATTTLSYTTTPPTTTSSSTTTPPTTTLSSTTTPPTTNIKPTTTKSQKLKSSTSHLPVATTTSSPTTTTTQQSQRQQIPTKRNTRSNNTKPLNNTQPSFTNIKPKINNKYTKNRKIISKIFQNLCSNASNITEFSDFYIPFENDEDLGSLLKEKDLELDKDYLQITEKKAVNISENINEEDESSLKENTAEGYIQVFKYGFVFCKTFLLYNQAL